VSVGNEVSGDGFRDWRIPVRSLAPEGTEVSSAESEPTRIRPKAVGILGEVGADPTGHRSKGMTGFETGAPPTPCPT